MDEFLPSEILAKIASNLSYKDVNSLLRTSKTAHAKLTPYRHILPKISCSLEIECQRDKISLIFLGHREKRANFYDRIVSGAKKLTEEENRDRVVQFYKGSQDAKVEETTTFRGRLEGLSLHIQTIQSLASIFSIELYCVDDDLVLEELARLMGQSRSRIRRISIHTKAFRSAQLDLITACEPRSLRVSGEVQLPDNFYNLPVIQKLTKLSLYHLSNEKPVHNLLLISATDIYIEGRHNITMDDIARIITQWAESTRRIRLIIFHLNNTLNKQKCTEWIGHLDNSLFEVKPDIHEEDEWILTRYCDCTKIEFEFAHDSLYIHSAV